jgi:CheY-like chemotaxis protein
MISPQPVTDQRLTPSLRGTTKRPPRWPVLVVDDANTCGRLAQALLAKLGFEAVVVSNGYEAVAAIEQGSYDLVLMDVRMPVLDGLDATRLIRSRWPDRSIPIYAMTGVPDGDDCSDYLLAGMDGFVTKPVRIEVLAAVVGTDPCAD